MIHTAAFHSKRAILAVALVGALAFSGPDSARAAATSKILSTNFTLVNMDKQNSASGTISYLLDSGALWPGVSSTNLSFRVSANGGSLQVKQYFDPTMQSGRGSVVIASDRPLGAIVQIQARGQTPTQGAYTGFLEGHSVYYLPLVARNRYTLNGTANSQIIIQNADSKALPVSIQLIPAAGVSGTYTRTIESLAPGVSYYYDLSDEGNLPAEWLGSAVVTASGSGKITVVSNFFQGADILQTYNGFQKETVGPEWIVPLFFSRLDNGLSSVVTVQNVGPTAIAAGGLVLHCTAIGTSMPKEFTAASPSSIAPSGSYSFNPIADSKAYAAKWSGTCDVRAAEGANLVAIVQLRFNNAPDGNIGASAYEAVRAGGTDRVMFVPLVAKRLTNGFASVVGIRNLGADATSLTLYYIPATNGNCPVSACDMTKDGKVDAADTIVVKDLSLPGKSSLQRNHRLASASGSGDAERTLPDNWEGALRIESSSQPIDGYVQLTYYKNISGDQYMAHRAFTRATP
jgi:hypothetical protein